MPPAKTTALTPEQQDLATRYVLGELSDADVAAFEALYSADADFRRGYNDWAASLDAAADVPDQAAATAVAPGWAKRLASGGAVLRLVEKLGVVPAVLGALAAALLVVFVTNMGLLNADPVEPFAPVVAALTSETGTAVVTLTQLSEGGPIAVRVGDMRPSAGRVWEMWLHAEGSAPRSLGVIDTDETTVTLDGAAAGLDFPWMGEIVVTEEPDGGAGAAGPTGEVIARGHWRAG